MSQECCCLVTQSTYLPASINLATFSHTHPTPTHAHALSLSLSLTHTHTHTHSRSFVGQLYRGEAQTKSWSLIVSGHVTIRLVEGEEAAGEWKLAAFKKDKVD